MSTIAYDKPVKDLISQLNETGHVSHRSYKKTSVTLHHNAGRLSHEGVLRVWQSRPASAHFDVDGVGAVAQYVKALEYAWATGNTEGNQRTISIEMANKQLSPSWEVAEVTWKSAARLAAWLFATVVHERPSSSNFFKHSHWSATACAGPHIDKVWSQIMAEAQRAYDEFNKLPFIPETPTVPEVRVVPAVRPKTVETPDFPLPHGYFFGPKRGSKYSISGFYSHKGELTPWQEQMAKRGWTITADGLFGDQTARVARKFQAEKHLKIDGLVGPSTWAAAWYAPVT